ncbi:MAG: hypothetical protein MUC48_25460 [Leptolyngbya sp. Prado105]|jgi:hypothetical protein|nr:hypothetical protein [Leptolyngbya sp. Prado105]
MMNRYWVKKIAPWLVAGVLAFGAAACETGYEGVGEREGVEELDEGIGDEELGDD